MKIYDVSNYNKIYLLGDIHGEFTTLRHHIRNRSVNPKQEMGYIDKLRASITSGKKKSKVNDMLNNSVIIVAGDCGFGFNKKEYYNIILKDINNVLTEINTHLFFIRGNHDDPSYFDGETVNLSNIKAVPDYSIITTANDNILCVGGAISVDRTWRISQEQHINRFAQSNPKKLYWENESPFFDKDKMDEIANSAMEINFVVSHSAPSFINPLKVDGIDAWEESDANLINDIAKERKTFDDIYYYLINNNMPLKGWFYGHFHTDYSSKTKEYVPFLCMSNSFNFHNIYDILENNNSYNPTKVSFQDFLGRDHDENPRPRFGQPAIGRLNPLPRYFEPQLAVNEEPLHIDDVIAEEWEVNNETDAEPIEELPWGAEPTNVARARDIVANHEEPPHGATEAVGLNVNTENAEAPRLDLNAMRADIERMYANIGIRRN